MAVADIAEREFQKKYWATQETNTWAVKRERASSYLAKARAAAKHSKNLEVQPYKKQYENARVAEVSAMNAELAGQRGQLTHLLKDALGTPAGIGIANLRGTVDIDPNPPTWLTDRIPGPRWGDYDPGRLPLRLGALPGLNQLQHRRYERAYVKMEQALDAWSKAEDERKRKLADVETAIEAEIAAEAKRIALDNDQLAEFRGRLEAGERDTVAEYFTTVIETMAWPAGFPSRVAVQYEPTRTHLAVQFLLPTDEVIPRISSYTYDKEKDRVSAERLTDEAAADQYRSLIAQSTLRVLRELFGADEFNLIRTIGFDGQASSFDSATGQPVEPYLVSLTVDVCDFGAVDLSRVDPVACLQILAKAP